MYNNIYQVYVGFNVHENQKGIVFRNESTKIKVLNSKDLSTLFESCKTVLH